MTPSARQCAGIETDTVSGTSGRTRTVPGAASGISFVLTISIVEPGILSRVSEAHLSSGEIGDEFGASALAEATTKETAANARQTIAPPNPARRVKFIVFASSRSRPGD